MKGYLFIAFFIITLPLAAQNFVDAEVNDLAEKIASKIDARNNFESKRNRVKMIVVEDFTDTEGKVSKLGASLAEEFSLALSRSGITFGVNGAKDLAVANKNKKGVDLGSVWRGLSKVADGVTDDTNYKANRRNRDVVKSVDGAYDIVNSVKTNKERYKGIDAVVAGTLTESNDQYGLLIKVISTDKNYAILTNAKGAITKTPFILALEEEENKRIQNKTATTESSNSGGIRYDGGTTSTGQIVETNNTRVELLEAKQVGQKIECIFQITNIGPDIDLTMYGAYSEGKLIDDNNSYDYSASQIQLGELIDDRYVKKTLVTNNSTTAKITYAGVGRDVSRAARLTVRCHGHGGYFWVEFRDIDVL